MSRWPVIVVPGWDYLEPAFRDELAAYAHSGGRLVLIGSEPAKLFQKELADSRTNGTILTADTVDATFPNILKQALPEPVVQVTGATDLDVSVRTLNGKLTVHLVNTSGPHAHAPDGGIKQIPPIGPLTVSLRLPQRPKAIVRQPENKPLSVDWDGKQARVKLPSLAIYSILVVER